MRYYLSFLALLLTLSVSQEVVATSIPTDANQIINTTKNHLLSMLYQIQPKIQVEIPETLVFSDVESGIWYETAAKYVVSQQIMAGTSEDTFSPDLTVTRGLVAIVIANANKADLGFFPNVFHDASYQWYRDSANWCAQNGIMVGFSDEYFGGDFPVTREHLAIVLYQYQNFIGGSTQNTSDTALSRYNDHQNTSFFSRTALAWAVNRGLILGTDNNIRPDSPATRAEVAFAIYRLLEGE